MGHDLSELKQNFSDFLVAPEDVRPVRGLPTGIASFDEFLLWKGFPPGEISLICGEPGLGVSSLWLKAAGQLHQQGKWCAWINSDWRLYPTTLHAGLRWDRLIVVDEVPNEESFFWVLQEMITSALFDLIGCHLSRFLLKSHQLMKLRRLARTYKVTLVFLTLAKPFVHPLYALVVECLRDAVVIHRALHRPSPHRLEGVLREARSLSALFQSRRLLLG